MTNSPLLPSEAEPQWLHGSFLRKKLEADKKDWLVVGQRENQIAGQRENHQDMHLYHIKQLGGTKCSRQICGGQCTDNVSDRDL